MHHRFHQGQQDDYTRIFEFGKRMIMNFGAVFQAGFITELMIMLHFSVNAVQNELELPARGGGGTVQNFCSERGNS